MGSWQRRFSGAASAIGSDIMVDGQSREIAGVMPRGFRIADTDTDLIEPLHFDGAHVSWPASASTASRA